MAATNASLGVRPQGGRGSFGLFSHDVRPSLNCRTHERTFFTSITPSLHVSPNCRWISIGFMPRKWRNRIITRCSSNVNVAISVSKTLLQLDLVTSIQRVVQSCHLALPNLKNSYVSSNNFHVSICFHSPRKKLGDLRTWTPHVLIVIISRKFIAERFYSVSKAELISWRPYLSCWLQTRNLCDMITGNTGNELLYARNRTARLKVCNNTWLDLDGKYVES